MRWPTCSDRLTGTWPSSQAPNTLMRTTTWKTIRPTSEEDENEDAEEESLVDDKATLMYLEDREHLETEANYIQAYHSAYRDVRKELQPWRNERG